MVIAVLAYLAISVLLILGAFSFFWRALKSFRTLSPSTPPPTFSVDQLANAEQRQEIIAMLERQFHSSPSADP
ncbi:MAG: hypothetical protein HC919_05820 [Oscillatoriales cyanobacterium SM2_2_1]|nr:hypothetical protein [Oscillatoriales cyanobacterium SM2_2_1]